MKPNAFNTNLLLGAAFAGLALTDANAATMLTVYDESIDGDLSDDFGMPTDLTLTFADFLSDSAVTGTMTTGTRGTDGRDYFFVSMTGNAMASIPFEFGGTQDMGGQLDTFVNVVAHTSGTSLVNSGSAFFNSGTTRTGTFDFTVPADGLVRFQISNESSNATHNYRIGAVPETGTAALGLAGLAAAALRRRRQQG